MDFDIRKFKVIDSFCEDGYAHDKLTGKKYDCDSCPEVWEKVHKVMHKNTKLVKIFGNFDNNYEDSKEGIFRKLALSPKNDNSFVRYAIGGDTDFNMEFKKEFEFNRYCKNNKISEDVKEKIKQMYQHKYCYENFSLLLTTGGSHGCFQSLKGCGCQKFGRKDNVCMFISILDKEFYKGDRTVKNHLFDNVDIGYKKDKEKNKVANTLAKNIMCSYLKEFDDIYDYCKEIYKINEKNLVNKILDFAKCEYKEDYNTGICDFINIIIEMWECKRKFLEENK